MTLTIELPDADEAAWNAEAARRGVTPDALLREAARDKMQELIAGLKDRRTPQSLTELRPKLLPPPGKTAMQMIVGQWPGEETDEELQAALKAMG